MSWNDSYPPILVGLSWSTIKAMFTSEEIRRRLEKVFGKRQATALAEILAETYGELSRAGDFGELKEVLKRLAEAQARSEQRLEELARAQEKTEVRVGELAEAQAKTEERVGRLEAAVERLAEAQQETTVAVAELSRGIDQLRKQVGGLSETVGGDIEDIAYIVLHNVLRREFGWQVGALERSWQTWNGEPEEVNVFGEATNPLRPGERIWIVGEAKHNLTAREAERFRGQVERARKHLLGEIFPVCFCYRARPEVQEILEKAGIRLVHSYGKLV